MLGHSVIGEHIHMSRHMRSIFNALTKMSVTLVKNLASLELKGYSNYSLVIVDRTNKDILDYFTRIIKKYHPNSIIFQSISGEETGFLLREIEGQENMAFAIPYVSLVAAYVLQGKIKELAVFDPIHRDFYWTSHEREIYLNNFKVFTRSRFVGEKSMMFIESSRYKDCSMWEKVHSQTEIITRSIGLPCTALVSVISGQANIAYIQDVDYTTLQIANFLGAITKFHLSYTGQEVFDIFFSSMDLGITRQDLIEN